MEMIIRSLMPSLALSVILLLCSCSPQSSPEPPPTEPEIPEEGPSWYVSPSGSDEAEGSISAPFRTIARALEHCRPGEEIILRAGRYTESVRIRNPRITIRSHRGERGIIESPVDNEDRAICVEFDVDSSGGALKNVEVIGGFYYAVSFETRWDWGEADRSGASNILVEGCQIHHSGRDCIKIKPGCDHITVRDCDIHHSGAGYGDDTAMDDRNAEGIDNVNGDFMTVSDCTIHDIASTGIYFKGGASSCLVERCRISDCGAGGVMVGFDTSPEYFDLTVNADYYEAIDGTVKNCIVSNTGYAGIGLYASRNCSVLHNTIVNTARKGHAPLYFGISFQDWESHAKRPANINPSLVNNLVYQGSAMPRTMVYIRYSNELSGLSALSGLPDMAHNLYYSFEGSPVFADQRPDSYAMDMNLSRWQSHIAGDDNAFTADPLLENDFHLGSGSPALARALFLTGVTDDFDGDPRGNPPDIGADEH